MQATVQKKQNSEATIAIVVSPEDIQEELKAAAARLAEKTAMPGFRPGKAPYELVKSTVGEMKIWQEALEGVVRHAYARAVIDNNIPIIGAPEIEITKFAPGNPIEFTATVTLLPAVLSLPDLGTITIDEKPMVVEEKDIDAALKELQRMQTVEHEVDRPATTKDKVTMNLSMTKENVPIEGGIAKDHSVYLAEPYYIPGFTEELTGLKKNDTKTFTLKFPETHYQKTLAGQDITFTIDVQKVSELTPPALDDAFAKGLGQDTLPALRDLLRQNLATEAEERRKEREESAALEELVARATFEDIPPKLIDGEAENMTHELEHSVASQGLEFAEYLKKIGKGRDEVKLDFMPQAAKRVKTILALRALASREKLEVTDEEVAAHVAKAMNQYASDPEAQKEIRSEEYAERAKRSLLNRKTIEYLREKVVKRGT